MNNLKYVEKFGLCCPACESKNLDSGSIQAEAGVAWQNVWCNDCNAKWQDVYSLTGYESLEKSLTA